MTDSNTVKFFQGIYECLNEIRTKLSMVDSTSIIGNPKIYLPNYPVDIIQRQIVSTGSYWEIDCLKAIDKYIKDNAVILDIGANIGNHTLYWANERNAKKIYSFEPVDLTYDILKKNIEINKLQEIVELYNVGVSDTDCQGNISYYRNDNIGAAHVAKSENGKIKFISIDSLNIKEKIDFIKIDVEGTEIYVLAGAVKTIKKYKPIIEVESFNVNKPVVDSIFKELGYEQVEAFENVCEYVYKWAGKDN